MFRLLFRGFQKKSPLFENTNRLVLPKTESASGRPNRDLRYFDEDKLERLRGLIEQNVTTPGVSLSDNVKHLARNDKDFNEFLRQFRTQDEPTLPYYLDSPESLDIKKYLKDPKRTEQDRLDELYMLDKFRNKKLAEELEKLEKKSKWIHEFNDKQQEEQGAEKQTDDILTKNKIKNIRVAPRTYFNQQHFKMMFMDAGSSTNITKLARVNKRWVLLYMGDCNGIISYGRGVGVNYQQAFDMAVMQLKKNMICINIDSFLTCPGYITGHFNDTTVEIFRNQNQYHGHPHYYNIITLAGLRGFSMRLRCRNVNTHAIIYAFFQCFINNETPRMVSEKLGHKFYEISFGRAWKHNSRRTLEDIPLI